MIDSIRFDDNTLVICAVANDTSRKHWSLLTVHVWPSVPASLQDFLYFFPRSSIFKLILLCSIHRLYNAGITRPFKEEYQSNYKKAAEQECMNFCLKSRSVLQGLHSPRSLI